MNIHQIIGFQNCLTVKVVSITVKKENYMLKLLGVDPRLCILWGITYPAKYSIVRGEGMKYKTNHDPRTTLFGRKAKN